MFLSRGLLKPLSPSGGEAVDRIWPRYFLIVLATLSTYSPTFRRALPRLS